MNTTTKQIYLPSAVLRIIESLNVSKEYQYFTDGVFLVKYTGENNFSARLFQALKENNINDSMVSVLLVKKNVWVISVNE